MLVDGDTAELELFRLDSGLWTLDLWLCYILLLVSTSSLIRDTIVKTVYFVAIPRQNTTAASKDTNRQYGASKRHRSACARGRSRRLQARFKLRRGSTTCRYAEFERYSTTPSIASADFFAVARAKQLDCQEAPEVPDAGFLGHRLLRQMFKADKEQQFPDLLVYRQQFMSEHTGRVCTTFYNRVLGQKQYFTSDPENIKAMLATQFNDFDLGPTRAANMSATLGSGIVSRLAMLDVNALRC